MSNSLTTDLENAYKQFKLTNLPIFQNTQLISIPKLFKILTITELKDLPTVEAMNFYLYCNFFKNRLLYSPIFQQNLAYVTAQSVELKQRIKNALNKYDHMLGEIKSESDNAWVDSNIVILNEGLLMLDDIPNRCDYYDAEVLKYLKQNDGDLTAIEAECAHDFTCLAKLFSEVGRLIGRE